MSMEKMTLEDAIRHLNDTLANKDHKWSCEECRQEHEQLRDWLVRLSAYENTGLSPDEVAYCIPPDTVEEARERYEYTRKMKDEWLAYRESGWTPYDLVSVEWVKNALMLSKEFKRIGADPIHLNKLFEADRDGRVLELPCKVGDVVYTLGYYGGSNQLDIAELRVLGLKDIVRWMEDGLIGKTVFLTREEAEAAKSKEE